MVSFAVHPDGRTVLTGIQNNRAQLWDFTSSGPRPLGRPMAHPSKIEHVTFSPDGRIAVTSSNDGTTRCWDVATSKPLGPPLLHHGVLAILTPGPGRMTILTGGADQFVHFWELPPPWEGEPERIQAELEVLTGMVLEESGAVRELEAAEWQVRYRRLEQDRRD
jgi:WD40 repeat protein